MEAAFKSIKASLWSLPLAALIGSLVAFFLWSLDLATQTRFAHPGLLFLLPFAGLAMVSAYHHYGARSGEGNNLIIDEIHQPGGGVPLRMTPLILFSTVITHLFGGSAGREGTAVQMGGSLASGYARQLRLSPETTRVLLMCGIAAGFGAVFGTPIAGAIFAMEVLTAGRIEYRHSLPCLAAAFAGHYSCLAWNIHHTEYHISPLLEQNWQLLAKIAVAALAFGLCARLFTELIHRLSHAMTRLFPKYWLRPLAGGLAIVALCYAIHSTDYLGLGVSNPGGVSILSSFEFGGATPWSWLWKILFTVITLSSGFKGGEVTSLFFVGATLGNALAVMMGTPVDLFAGLGFVAVFAAATNTPWACAVMGMELFGGHLFVSFFISVFIAKAVSGRPGIYSSQR